MGRTYSMSVMDDELRHPNIAIWKVNKQTKCTSGKIEEFSICHDGTDYAYAHCQKMTSPLLISNYNDL